MRQHTRNTLGCGGGLSAAGKARRCVPPPGAPAGGEQQGTGSQHARDADTAQRDEQRAPGGALVAGCHAYITAVSGARRLAGREWRIDHEDMCACSPTNRSPRRTRHRPRRPQATPVRPTQVEPSPACLQPHPGAEAAGPTSILLPYSSKYKAVKTSNGTRTQQTTKTASRKHWTRSCRCLSKPTH